MPTIRIGRKPLEDVLPAGVGPRADRASARRWALLALPALAVTAVFFAYPVIRLMVRSFTEFPATSDSGFDNYSWFFGNSTQVAVLGRTFLTAGIVTAVCLAVGYPYAYLMTRVGPRWRAVRWHRPGSRSRSTRRSVW